ncbi:MAG TPA: serine hydrolase domain-containing protein [Steroidobacter sp.]
MSVVVLHAWLAIAGASVTTAAAADRFDDLRQQIRTALVEESIPSMAVAVAKDGKILWQEGFGWADRERRIAATEHTMYSLASISKPITTTALMTLVQAGKVDLDAPANDYLGNAKLRARVGDARQATVRRIADHTSGLPDHFNPFYADEPYRKPSMDETIARYGNLVTVPSEHSYYEYSNLGYGVLDYIVERVSGLSYADFLRREVFLPLGMTRSSVGVVPELAAYAATRYDPDGRPLPAYDFDAPGASAVFASAHDLLRFGMFHVQTRLADQKSILNPASLKEMHRRTSGEPAMGYGIGFYMTERGNYRGVFHGGVMGGVSTQLLLVPAERLAVVVLVNTKTPLAASMADRIAARVLPGWQGVEWPRRVAPTVFAPSSQLLGTWSGAISTYAGDVPVELSFQPDGDVHAQVGDGLPTLIAGAMFKDGVFRGSLSAHIGTADTDRYPYQVDLWLTLRGDVLNGAASAQGEQSPRVRSALAHWMEVRKQR